MPKPLWLLSQRAHNTEATSIQRLNVESMLCQCCVPTGIVLPVLLYRRAKKGTSNPDICLKTLNEWFWQNSDLHKFVFIEKWNTISWFLSRQDQHFHKTIIYLFQWKYYGGWWAGGILKKNHLHHQVHHYQLPGVLQLAVATFQNLHQIPQQQANLLSLRQGILVQHSPYSHQMSLIYEHADFWWKEKSIIIITILTTGKQISHSAVYSVFIVEMSHDTFSRIISNVHNCPKYSFLLSTSSEIRKKSLLTDV